MKTHPHLQEMDLEWMEITIRVAPVSEKHWDDCGFLTYAFYESPRNGIQNSGRGYCKDLTAVKKEVIDVIERALRKDEFIQGRP